MLSLVSNAFCNLCLTSEAVCVAFFRVPSSTASSSKFTDARIHNGWEVMRVFRTCGATEAVQQLLLLLFQLLTVVADAQQQLIVLGLQRWLFLTTNNNNNNNNNNKYDHMAMLIVFLQD